MTSSAKINKFLDNLKFDKFRNFRKFLLNLKNKNLSSTHDYGNGYFYQSFEKINLNGLRKTQTRVDALNLNNYIENKNVLDIGTNTGFLIMQTNLLFKKCVAIDWDKPSILIAKECQKKLEIDNINFFCKNFLEFESDDKFDLILSLANHTTYDGGIKNYIEYFDHIKKFLKKNSILIFESHHPEIESDSEIEQIIKYLENSYELIDSGIYKFKNYADDNRKFFVFKFIE
tara:strand:+ start:790 stop:1479 length:690 start_codon:yes stop_codon:yes gene_type:complete